MNLAALCDDSYIEVKMAPMDTVWLFSVPHGIDVAFVSIPPLSTPIEVLVVLAMPVKIYVKWRVIQLAIHSTVGVDRL